METQTNQLFHEEICASGVVIDRICKDVHQEINALCPLADRQHARASFLMTGVLVFFISLPIAATYLYLTGGLPFSIQLIKIIEYILLLERIVLLLILMFLSMDLVV